ncbi:MAG: type II secretion system F family protein, partial [Bdellovibrionota bacterium]
IITDVGAGKRLAETMKKHPQIFDQMYTNLVNAGEESGKLDTVLDRLAGYIEKSVKLKAKLKGAMFYPIAVLAVSALVISGILWFVIPKFVEIFQSSGMQLPWLTQKVVDGSDYFKNHWYLFVGAAFLIPMAFRQYYATDDGKRTLDSFFLKIPVFGDLIIKGGIARFARTMSTMLAAGVKIIEAIDIAAGTTGNWVVEQTFLTTKESINKGKTFSEPLKKAKFLPEMVSQMIAVGEQTGSLDAMLDKVANFYEEEVEQATDAMTSVIEPIMMVFLGGIVAVLVIAMYLPIFGMAGAAGAG